MPPEQSIPLSFRAQLARLGRRLIEPHSSIVEPAERARARLLRVLLLGLIVVTVAYELAYELGAHAPNRSVFDLQLALVLVGLAFVVVAYWVSFTGRHQRASAIFVVGSTFVLYFYIATEADTPMDAAWLLLGPLVCSLFLSVRTTLWLLAGTCLSVLLLPQFASFPSGYGIAGAEIFLVVMGFVVVGIAVMRRQDQLRLETQSRTLLDNIAERKRAEKGLRASQQIIEGIVNAIPARVFWKDNNLVYLGCNTAFAHDAGFTDPKDIIGKDDYQMGWGAQADFYRADDRQVIESGCPKLLVEEPQTTPEGNTITLLTSKIPLLNSQGEISGVLGTYLDITERKQAENALRQSEHLLREAQVVANLGSYVLDIPAGSWTSSDMLDVVFGIGQAYDRSVEGWLALVHPDDRAMMFDHLSNEVLSRGRAFDKEYRIVRHADQAERWVYGLGRVEFDAQGLPLKMVGTIQDITERKRGEEALSDSEERLRQSQRLEAVGSLAGGIAHDFNNLLTAVIGQTELLRQSSRTSAECQDGLGEIRNAADRAAALTRQLLAFSRRQALQPRILDVNEVIESMVGLLKSLLGENIYLGFRKDPALWPVEADPGQLEQVIMNLAVNARDAMPRGGRLTIETANVEIDAADAAGALGAPAGSHVLLTVSDTGCGMDEETLSHVFEPFFTTRESGEGTGLGLSTVYGIVKQSGGNIWAYSEPGQGSTFKIFLPRAEKPIDWSPTANVSPDRAVETGNETILVVEDEPAVRHLTTRVLGGQGYRVLAAESPEEAIALVDTHPDKIDLILSDVLLPGMSGQAMVDLLLNKPGSTPRVLYMSGYTRDALVHQGRLDEGIALLEKPFTLDGLLRKVREVLDAPFGGQPTIPV